MISNAPKVPHLAIRELFTVLKMWNFLKNTHFSTSEQYKPSNFNLGPIVHPRNHLSRWKLDFLFYDYSQILVIKCNRGQKPLWYIRSELTVQCHYCCVWDNPCFLKRDNRYGIFPMFSLHNSTISWENPCLAPVSVQSHLQWSYAVVKIKVPLYWVCTSNISTV